MRKKTYLLNIFPLYGGFTAFLLIFCIQKKQAYDFSSILGNSSNELAAKDGHSYVLTDFHYSNFLLMWKLRKINSNNFEIVLDIYNPEYA